MVCYMLLHWSSLLDLCWIYTLGVYGDDSLADDDDDDDNGSKDEYGNKAGAFSEQQQAQVNDNTAVVRQREEEITKIVQVWENVQLSMHELGLFKNSNQTIWLIYIVPLFAQPLKMLNR